MLGPRVLVDEVDAVVSSPQDLELSVTRRSLSVVIALRDEPVSLGGGTQAHGQPYGFTRVSRVYAVTARLGPPASGGVAL